jgi:WD40 repeat protein
MSNSVLRRYGNRYVGVYYLFVMALAITWPSKLSAQDPIILKGHQGPVLMAKFTTDGRVATVSSDETARLWNADGQLIREYKGHTGPLYCLTISRDGQTLVTGAQDNTLRIWDVPLSHPTQAVVADSRSCAAIAVSPDERWLVTVGAGEKIAIWQTEHWQKTSPTPEEDRQRIQGKIHRRTGHDSQLTSVAVRGDGTMFATADASGRIVTWSPFTDAPQGQIESSGIKSLFFSSNNQQLISYHVDGQIRVWKLPLPATDAEVIAVEGKEHPSLERKFDPRLAAQEDGEEKAAEGAGTSMASFNNAAQVVTGTGDGHLLLSDVNNGTLVREFLGLSASAQAIASRPDNQRLAAGGADGRVVIWNAANAEQLEELTFDAGIVALTWSPDNQKLAVATDQGGLFVYGRPDPSRTPVAGAELSLHQEAKAAGPVTAIVFAKDSRSMWTTHGDGTLGRWAYASPIQVRQLNHGGAVYGLDISDDGKTIVSCSADRTVRVWTVEGQQRFSMSGHSTAVHAVALSPDGALIVSAGADKTIRLWDATGGRQLKQLATFPETMYAVSFAPTGKQVAVAGADRVVYLIDVLTGETVRTFAGHADFIHCVRFNAAGNRLLSYGYAGELRVWNADSGASLLNEHVGRIGNYADYSEDGQRLLLANGDGTARIIVLPESVR